MLIMLVVKQEEEGFREELEEELVEGEVGVLGPKEQHHHQKEPMLLQEDLNLELEDMMELTLNMELPEVKASQL